MYQPDSIKEKQPGPATLINKPIITGLLCNPESGRFKKKPAEFRSALKALPVTVYHEAVTANEIHRAVEMFSETGVDLVILVCGDGTVQTVLTHMFGIRDAAMPVIAVIPAGTTNMTALNLGTWKKPLACISPLAAVLTTPGSMKFVSQPVLRINQGNVPSLYGMFFGCGLIPHGVKHFNSTIRKSGVTNEYAGGLVMCRYLLDILVRPGTQPAIPLTVIQDGQGTDHKLCLAAFATTLDRLLLGIRPYRNLESGPLFFTVVDNNMKSVWSSVISLLAGTGGRGTGINITGNINKLELVFDGDFIVDGELYNAHPQDGPLRISTTAPVNFLVL